SPALIVEARHEEISPGADPWLGCDSLGLAGCGALERRSTHGCVGAGILVRCLASECRTGNTAASPPGSGQCGGLPDRWFRASPPSGSAATRGAPELSSGIQRGVSILRRQG